MLQQASEQLGKGQWQHHISVHKGSVIASVITAFNDMSSKISRLMEEQKELTNSVSHEIRIPLARLKFCFAMLDQHGVSQLPEMRQDVEEIENLVDEMLAYGRLESQVQSLSIVDVDISQLLSNQVEKLARTSDKKLDLVIVDQLKWRCDGHFIERACQNFIANALHHADSRVTVSAYVKHHWLHIEVEDDGGGIAESDFERVFKAFTRLDNCRNNVHCGFGLGLAMVTRIVDRHRGQCVVARLPLGGAKFSMLLPKSPGKN